MKRVLHLILLILLFAGEANSQQISLGLQSGIGTYSMDELKKINNSVLDGMPFDAEMVADFPPYLYFRPFVMTRRKGLNLGLNFTYQSTGSRVSSKDYSGEYRFDMVTNSFGPGAFCEIDLNPYSELRLTGYTSLGLMFSELTVTENLTVLDNPLIDESYRFKAKYVYAEPGLKLSYPVGFMVIGINAGYMITLKGLQYSLAENSDYYLQSSASGDPVKPEWNGFRLGLSVVFALN